MKLFKAILIIYFYHINDFMAFHASNFKILVNKSTNFSFLKEFGLAQF